MEWEEAQENRPERIKEGEFREWYFPIEEVLEWTRKFLEEEVGYKLQPSSYIGFVQPDFHAKRKTEKREYEVVGVGCQHYNEAVDGLAKLMALKAVLGDSADYVLVLPPVSEHLMLEFFRSEEGRWYFEIKRQEFMVWLCNPDEEFTCCIVGGPQDRLFEEYFLFGKMPLDMSLSMQLSGVSWDAEEY
ncbi:MAG: hypothetical protein WC560_07815 [Syntrophales bacterium]